MRSRSLQASSKRRRSGEREARSLVFSRARKNNWGRCEVCCRFLATDWAHRVARSQMGQWRASNGLAACAECHRAQREPGGRAVAELMGQVLPAVTDGCKTDPERVPVNTAYGWVFLRDDGSIQSASGAVMTT